MAKENGRSGGDQWTISGRSVRDQWEISGRSVGSMGCSHGSLWCSMVFPWVFYRSLRFFSYDVYYFASEIIYKFIFIYEFIYECMHLYIIMLTLYIYIYLFIVRFLFNFYRISIKFLFKSICF